MKCFRRSLLLFVVFVLLSVTFSISVNAQSVDVSPFYVTQNIGYHFKDTTTEKNFNYDYNFEPRDGTRQFETKWIGWEYASKSGVVTFSNTMHYQPTEHENIFEGTGNVTLTIKYAMPRYYICDANGKCNTYFYPDNNRILLHYSDGTMEYVDSVTIDRDERAFVSTFSPKKVVHSFEIITTTIISPADGDIKTGFDFGEVFGDTGYEVLVDIQSEETGLLKGIIEWLKGIKDGITNLFDSIIELPVKIWNYIQDGLKFLFVPDEEYIIEFKGDIDILLSEKLGAVYQVVNILTDSWDRIKSNDEQNVIVIPMSSISLPDDNSFSFGGYSVDIVPNGFEFIVDIIKTLIGIVCTVMFVNGLRRKYDEVMGGK